MPWYVGDGDRIRPVSAKDLREARPALEELLGLLTELRVVVLMGKKAQAGWDRLERPPSEALDDLTVLRCPHPSARGLAVKGARTQILRTLRRALRVLVDEGSVCPSCGGRGVPILYGYPTAESWEKERRGEAVLGGCVMMEINANQHCVECGREWYSWKEQFN